MDGVQYVAKNMRLDLRLIAEMIPHDARVLDIGCGDGALIEYLAREKRADARGIEIDMAQVTKAVSAGLAVIHGDADNELVPDVAPPRLVTRYRDVPVEIVFGEQFGVAGGVVLTPGCPGVEMGQFHPEDSSLDRVEAAVDADHLVIIARLHAMNSEFSERFSEIITCRCEKASITESTKVFCRIKTEASYITESTTTLPVPS